MLYGLGTGVSLVLPRTLRKTVTANARCWGDGVFAANNAYRQRYNIRFAHKRVFFSLAFFHFLKPSRKRKYNNNRGLKSVHKNRHARGAELYVYAREREINVSVTTLDNAVMYSMRVQHLNFKTPVCSFSNVYGARL